MVLALFFFSILYFDYKFHPKSGVQTFIAKTTCSFLRCNEVDSIKTKSFLVALLELRES